MPLLNTATKLYSGVDPAKKVYLGTTLVWTAVSTWTPASFPGLSIWLDASQLGLANGAPVGPWPNLGSAGPGTMYATPLPVVRTAALNGLPVVRFTRLEGRLRMTGTGVTTDFTILFVGRMWSTDAGARFLCVEYNAGASINFLFGYYGTVQDTAYDHVAGWYGQNAPTDTTWRMYSGDAANVVGGNPRLFRNGTLLTTATSGLASGMGNTLYISGYTATGPEEVGDVEIAEVIIYNRKLSDADRQQVEGYLKTKWGTP